MPTSSNGQKWPYQPKNAKGETRPEWMRKNTTPTAISSRGPMIDDRRCPRAYIFHCSRWALACAFHAAACARCAARSWPAAARCWSR